MSISFFLFWKRSSSTAATRAPSSSFFLVFSHPILPLQPFSHNLLLDRAGLDEILRVQHALAGHAGLGGSSVLVLVLHSAIAPGEQQRAFRRPPPVCVCMCGAVLILAVCEWVGHSCLQS